MIFNLGGAPAGETLNVTAPAGVDVTVSKGNKSRTKTADTAGNAMFKCLTPGTWKVAITDGTQNAEREIEIGRTYSINVQFFTATVSVTYPEGSTCTCYNATATFTAPDTSGSCVFTIPSAGTWFIKSTDGTNEATDKVTISEDGQSFSFNLEYNLRLYSAGDQHENTTGGWVGLSNYSFTANGIEVGSGDSGSRWAVGTKNSIDLTNYKTLVVIMDVTSMVEYVKIGLTNQQVVYDDPPYTTTLTTITGKTGKQTFELDISSITTGNWVTLSGKYAVGTITDIYCMK